MPLNPDTKTLDAMRRTSELSSLGFLYRREIEDVSLEGRRSLLAKLDKLLSRLNRDMRAPEPPWHYSPARHNNAIRIRRREKAELAAMEAERVAA
jgi:hypothetical protein